jgi:hypothetical protein
LGSGNLAAAQTAYNNITTLGQAGPFANGDAFRSTQREQDFTAIGQALQAGDLAGAQQAFSALKATGLNLGSQTTSTTAPTTTTAASTPAVVLNLSSGSTTNSAATGTTASTPIAEIVLNFSSGGSTNGATTPTPTSATGPEIVLNLSDNGSSTNPEQITIAIGNYSSGGEQVSISAGSQGSDAQQVTLNLAANSNEEIILNFLQASASPTSTANSTTSGSPSTGLSVTA